MNKRHWIIASVLAGLIGIAGIAHAFGGHAGWDKEGYSGEDHCYGKKEDRKGKHHGEHRMNGIKHLDLTDEQQTAIKAIKVESREQMEATRSELSDIQKSLYEQSNANTYDAVKVRELADTEAKFRSDMIVQRVQTMHSIRKELTEEQLAELEKNQSQYGNKGHQGGRGRF